MQETGYQKAVEHIHANRERLTETVMQRSGIYLNEHYTRYQVDKCRQDTIYNLQYLAESLMLSSPSLWENYVQWLGKLLGSLGLSMQGLASHFRFLSEVLDEELDAESASYVKKLTDTASRIVLSDTHINIITNEATVRFAKEARKYLDLLLTAQKHKALEYIDHLVENGVSIRQIYLDILQPVQREIGNLWHVNKISVAQEHYCTGVSQLAIARLYPKMFNASPRKHKMVSSCVQGELHELGLRMVTDIMELDGWNTFYLGANMPDDSIIDMIKQQNADLLAISVTFPLNLHKAEKLISQIRANTGMDKLKILVGGYAFMQDSSLWRKIGADSFAPNADIASKVASGLVEGVS